MAELVKSEIGTQDAGGILTFAAATGSDYFTDDNADGRLTLLVRNTNASQSATVTLKAGDGSLSTRGDLSFPVVAGATAALPMARAESARVKVLGGANSGRVLVSTAVDSGGSVASVLYAVLSVQ